MFRLHFTPVMSWAKRNAWCDCLVQYVISTFCKHNAAKLILEKFSIQRVWACLGGAGTNFVFGTIHKGRPQNFWDFGPPPPPCPHFG